MRKLTLNYCLWWFWIYLIRFLGLGFQLSPVKLPRNEGQKLYRAAKKAEVLIVFNPGGWGDATLERAGDFAPILQQMQKIISTQGYRTEIVPYRRTLPSLSGRCAGTKDQLLSFKHSAQIQVADIKSVAGSFPEKHFILAGFSTGGGLTGRAMKSLTECSNVLGLMVGVPGWFHTFSSPKSLVLNNSNQDPIAVGRVWTIAVVVFKSPLLFLYYRLKGKKISFPLCLHFPFHEYNWDSPEISIPVIRFLKLHFRTKNRMPLQEQTPG